jgi:DNA-directed RNA polymerase beta' subunit
MIKSITFYVPDANEIRNTSVVELKDWINSHADEGINSSLMGAIIQRLTSLLTDYENRVCATCHEEYLCCGHFGHIELNQPVIHPFFQEEVVKYMNTFCYFCHKLVLLPQSILGIDGFHQKCSEAEQCSRCGKIRPKFYEDDNEIFGHYGDMEDSIPMPVKGILEDFKRLDTQDLAFLHSRNPSRFIITSLPIFPPQYRPPHISERMNHLTGEKYRVEYNNDITMKYFIIMKMNGMMREAKNEIYSLKYSDSLKYHVRTFMRSRSKSYHPQSNRNEEIDNILMGKENVTLHLISIGKEGRDILGRNYFCRDVIEIITKYANFDMDKNLMREEMGILKKFFKSSITVETIIEFMSLEVPICKKCGIITNKHYKCSTCESTENIVQIQMSRHLKELLDMFMSMCIFPKFLLDNY